MSALLTLSLPIAVHSAITPSTLYQRALISDLMFSYRGRQFLTSYGDDGRSESYVTDVQHRSPNDYKIVYEEPDRDVGRVIVEDDRQQWTLLPHSKVIVHSSQNLPLTRKQASAKYELLKQNYELTVVPTPTWIADRKAFELDITSKDGNGTEDRLWIDPDTGVVLRKEQYHADGALDSVMYFSEIKVFGGKTASIKTFSPPPQGLGGIVEAKKLDEKVIKRTDVMQYFGKSAICPERIGRFQLQSLTVLRSGRELTLHLRYSDGLVSLSLFETVRTSRLTSTVALSQPIKLPQKLPGRVVRRYSYNLLNWDTPYVNFTFVGDVRVETLAKLTGLLDYHPI